MKISNVITPKTTGYTALAGLGLTVYSGIAKNKTLRKSHKGLAIATSAITLMHVGQIEYYHFKYR